MDCWGVFCCDSHHHHHHLQLKQANGSNGGDSEGADGVALHPGLKSKAESMKRRKLHWETIPKEVLVPHHTTTQHTIPQHNTPYYTILRHTTPYYTILHHTNTPPSHHRPITIPSPSTPPHHPITP